MTVLTGCLKFIHPKIKSKLHALVSVYFIGMTNICTLMLQSCLTLLHEHKPMHMNVDDTRGLSDLSALLFSIGKT